MSDLPDDEEMQDPTQSGCARVAMLNNPGFAKEILGRCRFALEALPVVGISQFPVKRKRPRLQRVVGRSLNSPPPELLKFNVD